MSSEYYYLKKQLMIGGLGFCLAMLLYLAYFLGSVDACNTGQGTLYKDGIRFACFSEKIPECFLKPEGVSNKDFYFNDSLINITGGGFVG